MSDYYELLGVPRSAELPEIRAAFRQRALELHPDRSGDGEDSQEFRLVTEAYEILSDVEARSAYDEALSGYRSRGGVSIKEILEGIGSVAGLFMEASARAHPSKAKAGLCQVCKGSGELSLDLGVLHISKRCEACRGSGKIEPVSVEEEASGER